ncbi:MAG TPA: hypothetical protein VEI97_21140, partial [bacterium]|nr:hypothetical protein [bacterium]
PDNRPEWGATLTEEGNGTIAITYIAEHLWFPSPTNAQRASPGYRSLWQGGGWTAGTDQVGGVPSTGGGSDPNTVPQWGWYLKASPNWGVPGTAYLQTANNPVNHTINTSWRSLVLGYLAPDANGPPADCAGMVTAVSYCADFAISRTTGAMYSFGDALDFSYTPGIVVRQGGPNNWCLPTTGWNGAVPTATVDSRPSHISRWRSTASDAAGGIHLAYRSVDKGRVSYARSPSGAVTGFTTADLALGAAGEFADPTLEYDPTSGLYVVSVQAVSGGGSQLVYWRSTDGGVSFAPMAVAGAPMATEPTDLSVSARSIAGHSVIAIGYFSGGQQWLRWSANNGGAWTDVALTPGPTDYSGEILIDRDSPDFFCVFSRFDAGGRSNVMARHGTFGTP